MGLFLGVFLQGLVRDGWVVGVVREILTERFVLCVKMANIVYTSDC